MLLLAVWLPGPATGRMGRAQGVSTTTVQGTVYLANGQPGSGTLMVSWPAFTTATGQSVAADKTMVTIPPDGFVSVNLAPNQGATPAGLYYTAVFYLSDGTVNTQYWVVPAGAQATLAQVQAQVMPAAQAVQAVSKAYVDQTISELTESLLTASGGNLSGPLYLSGDPTQPLEAATKHYVDSQVGTAVPLGGGNMSGALNTPTVNGVQAPAAGAPQTTLQAAMNAAGTNGAMQIPPTYAGTDTFTNPNGVRVTDLRTAGAQQTTRSVKEFGAVCDGVTDDTNALQAALNYANAHGVALTIPQGICKTHALNWRGESMGGLGKQVSALMGFPGQDVLSTAPDATNFLSYTRLHDLTIYVDQSLDASCTPAEARGAAGSCQMSRPMEANSIFSPGGNGLTGLAGTGAAWSVGNCAIAMPAATGAGGNGLKVAEIENVEIAATGVDPMTAQYPGAHSTHTCGMYLAQWPQWSEFRNIDIRGLNTGIAIPALPGTTPARLTADSNRWQNITIQATHGFTAAAGSNNVLDNVVEMAGNSSATGEPPTGLVLDLGGNGQNPQQGWTVRNAVVMPAWIAAPPALTVTTAGGAVTGVTVGAEHGLGWDPYGTTVPLAFSGSCTAQATAAVNADGSIGNVTVTQGGVGCSATTTASVNAAGTWDTAAAVNLVAGQSMTFFAGNLLKGNGGYTVWNASGAQSYGTQLNGGGGTLPGGGSYPALVANSSVGSTLEVDQFPGGDFGAKLEACLGAVSASYGGTCDARNFVGAQSMGANLTIATGNTTVLLPCATIATANQILVTAGTRNVALRGCALRGGSAASGSQGGTVFAYSGAGAMVQVGDVTYATDTPGFHMDNVEINTTASTSATAEGLAAYRTQEMDVESVYFLGNANQTGMTLDGTGNYTGGTFLDIEISGFQTAVNGIGHQAANPATTDWMNASAFVRLHIDCPTSSGKPVAGTTGINLLAGDGNTFTGGDVEGCATALHLGPNAENNTIVGLRNENSTSQVTADAGSAYNNWMTGGTMFTGQLTDNGTRNSFLDSFHRSFNGLNGDWYGSQQDATLTNHYRLGTGTGNERGLQDEYQTDYGYRWEVGPGDGTSGEQSYNFSDLLNNVQRIGIGQYLSATPNVVTNVIVNNGGCYSSSATPAVSFTGGGGSGASATVNMTTTTSPSCPGGYTVGSVMMTSGGSGYTTQPTVSFTGSNQTTAPNAVAEITTAGSTNNQTVINAAGTGAVVLNGSSNAGTGGVVFGSGGTSETTVATVDRAGDAQFNGTLQVGGTAQSTGTLTVRNNSDAEVDYYLWPGLTTSQKGSFTYKDWNGNSQWYMVKDASNNWALNSAIGGLDSFKAYQSTNSGDTYINAANASGVVRLNYESGSGTQFKVYGGNSSTLYAAFTGTTAIQFPGLAASSGHNCLQIDNSGYITNTGSACGSGAGSVSSGSSGQIAYYTGNGAALGGMNTVPPTAGGTGATNAAGALTNLGAFAYPGAAGIPYGLTASTSRGATGADLTGLLGYTPLQPGNNLSDLASPATALTNLGAFAYPGATGIPYGLTGSTSRAATGADLTGLLGYTPLRPVNNLSDLASPATALANLGGQANVPGLSSDGNNGVAIQENIMAGGGVDGQRIGRSVDALAYGLAQCPTDTTAALQAAITAANGAPVELAAGKYCVSAPLYYYTTGATNRADVAGLKLIGAGYAKTQLLMLSSFTVPGTVTLNGVATPQWPAVIDVQGVVSSSVSGTYQMSGEISGMEITTYGCEANASAGEPACAYPTTPAWITSWVDGIAGISIEGVWHMNIHDMWIHEMSGDGIWIPDRPDLGGTGDTAQSFGVSIHNNHITNNLGWGIYLSNPTSGDTVDTNLIQFNSLGGIKDEAESQTFTHNSISSNGCGGVFSGTPSSLGSCTTNPLGSGLVIGRAPGGGGPYNVTVRDNYFDSNARAQVDASTVNNLILDHNTYFSHAGTYVYNSTFPANQQIPKQAVILGEVAVSNPVEGHDLDRTDYACNAGIPAVSPVCQPNAELDPDLQGINLPYQNSLSASIGGDFFRGNVGNGNFSTAVEGSGGVAGFPAMSAPSGGQQSVTSWSFVNQGEGYTPSLVPTFTVVGGDAAWQTPTLLNLTVSNGVVTGCSVAQAGGPYSRTPITNVEDIGVGSPGTGAAINLTMSGSSPSETVASCSVSSGGSGYLTPIAGVAPVCATQPQVTAAVTKGISSISIGSSGNNYGPWVPGQAPPVVTATVTDSTGTGYSVTPVLWPEYSGSSVIWRVVNNIIPDGGHGYGSTAPTITYSTPTCSGCSAATGTVNLANYLSTPLTVTTPGSCDQGATPWLVVHNAPYPASNTVNNSIQEQNVVLSSQPAAVGSTAAPVPRIVLGSSSTDNVTVSGAFTGQRALTIPDAANSNPVVPLASPPSGGCVGYIDSSGVQHGTTCATPGSNVALYGAGFVEWQMDYGGTTFSGIGDEFFGCSSATLSNVGAGTANPILINSASATILGDCAGWTSNPVYLSTRNPFITFGVGYAASSDYASTRIWLGIEHGCTAATMGASDTPSCPMAAIRYSTVAGDSVYQCVTSTGSAQTTTAITGATPSTAYTQMSINVGSSGVTCTVGSNSATNTTNLPNASGVTMEDVFTNTPQGAAAALNLRLNGVYGYSQNGNY